MIMGTQTQFDGATHLNLTTCRLLSSIALLISSILFGGCGSSTTPLGNTSTAAPLTVSTGVAINSAASNEVNKAGNGSNGDGTGAVTGTTTGTGTNTPSASSTTSAVVTPSFAKDPLAAFKRLFADIAMLNEFELLFHPPPNFVTPTVLTGQDFRYINCDISREPCRGTISLTRSYATAGTFAEITAGTDHAFSYQNYEHAALYSHKASTGTAYLAFPEGFTVLNNIYNGKASLNIKLKAPGPVIDWNGRLSAANLKLEGGPAPLLTGTVEVLPNAQPTWVFNITHWRTYGVVQQGSQLTITENGQSADIAVESATDFESNIRMTYNVNGQPTMVRIKQTSVGGVLSYALQ
jgi:hypothetical protein